VSSGCNYGKNPDWVVYFRHLAEITAGLILFFSGLTVFNVLPGLLKISGTDTECQVKHLGNNRYEVTLQVNACKVYTNEKGNEPEAPGMNDYIFWLAVTAGITLYIYEKNNQERSTSSISSSSSNKNGSSDDCI
jgi:hypothetical protein